MPTDELTPKPGADSPKGGGPADKPRPTPAAERALAEAAARRAAADGKASKRPTEIQGRNGPEPTRYGDWEINGLAADF